ncbi:MAG TPA: signal peptide peptidase SppA [Burkholderiaceae bacterium]|nr:signal peptide peptidase SppA [Burkholderiaceae bacterium]
MPSARPGLLRRFFGFLWSVVDGTRRLVLNLIFLLLVAALLFAWLFDTRPRLHDDTTLVLALEGRIVEQYSGSRAEAALAEAVGEAKRETQLRDLLDALDAAAADPKITRALLLTDDLEGAGLATLREVAAALRRFREAGKQVIAWGGSFDQRQYFLAAHADEVYLHPLGGVLLRGFGGYRNYYREALDRLGVSVNVFRAGQYKSFAEPFTQSGPSKEALEDEARWINDAWALYVTEVESVRGLPAGSINQLIDQLPQRFKVVGGDPARLALEEKLVDGLKTRDELRALMIERGARDEQHGSFRQIGLAQYLALLDAGDGHGDAIGVIVAQGEIVDGDAPQGVVGGRTVADLIRRARDDKRIKAIVLRVDSPGGMLMPSEMIRRELEVTRNAGKPVVVSMGDTAASGGYWIAMAADEVLADPATITGSIGVFALLPSADKAWDKLGIRTGGVTTTWLAGAADPRRPLDKRVADLLQTAIEHSYRQFVGTVARARKMDAAALDPLAQGRVWTGRQAQARGLVDTLGGLSDAIARAADRAQLGDDFDVVYVEREPRGIARYLALLFGELFVRARVQLGLELTSIASVAQAKRELVRDLRWLGGPERDPFTTYAHCLCRLW